MIHRHTTILGKAVRRAARLRGGGSALPGLFVEKIDPEFTKRCLENLPRGVVVISGTNGKTTTTKMVVELLESIGMKVFTNRTGSNFSRGVAAALLGEVDSKGRLNADIAVLELDEAHAVHFVKKIPPRYSLLLNVMRDQLDRFGEIDKTASMLEAIAAATTDTVVLNREDPRVAKIAEKLTGTIKTAFFGLSNDLRSTFPSDDEIHSITPSAVASTTPTLVSLEAFTDHDASFKIKGQIFTSANLKLQGIYNIFNAAAALSLIAAIQGDEIEPEKLTAALSDITPAFGRGEKLQIAGQPLELVLVKNPGGFRLGLKSFPPENYSTMIAINDNYADGRDLSWLWDVDFESLRDKGVAEVTGIRAYDMALRLQYDEIAVSHITTDLTRSLKHFIDANKNKPKRIYCTYTAMLALRRELSRITEVEVIS